MCAVWRNKSKKQITLVSTTAFAPPIIHKHVMHLRDILSITRGEDHCLIWEIHFSDFLYEFNYSCPPAAKYLVKYYEQAKDGNFNIFSLGICHQVEKQTSGSKIILC